VCYKKVFLCLSILILLNHTVDAGDEKITGGLTLEQAVSLSISNNPSR